MDLRLPPAHLLPFGLRAMKCVGEADGHLDDTERRLMQAAQDAFGTDVDVDGLEPIAPTQLASAVTDPTTRWQLIHALIVMSAVDGEVVPQEASKVREYALALEVELDNVETLEKLARGQFMRARLDVVRHFWAREKIVEQVREQGITWLIKALAALARVKEDTALAERYRALEHYPGGSLGRTYFEFVRSNGFSLPGEKGSPPEVIIRHDLTHVLSGYGTDPEGELQAVSFHAGYRKDHPFTFLLFGMLQFHLGIRVSPIAAGFRGNLDPAKMLAALRRGAAMNIDLTADWDPWAVMDRQVDDLRQEYGIPPA